MDMKRKGEEGDKMIVIDMLLLVERAKAVMQLKGNGIEGRFSARDKGAGEDKGGVRGRSEGQVRGCLVPWDAGNVLGCERYSSAGTIKSDLPKGSNGWWLVLPARDCPDAAGAGTYL